MTQTLQTIEIIVSVLLIASVLLQQSGASLGGTFGGENTSYRNRRGAEQFLFQSTIFLAVVFVATAVALVLLSH